MTGIINSIGIIKESRPDESRAPIAPNQVSQIIEQYPGINIFVQPCDKRTFKNEEYEKNGAKILDNLNNCDLLINCTSMGMEGGSESLEISFGNVKNTTIIYDLVYTPLETPLIKRAKEAGLLTTNGLRMLISQAAPAFMIFYGDKTHPYARDPLSYHYAINKSKDNVFTMDEDAKLFKILEKDIGKHND